MRPNPTFARFQTFAGCPAGGTAVGQFGRQAKLDGLLAAGQFAHLDRTEPAQCVDHVLDQHLRRGGAGGDADGLGAVNQSGSTSLPSAIR